MDFDSLCQLFNCWLIVLNGAVKIDWLVSDISFRGARSFVLKEGNTFVRLKNICCWILMCLAFLLLTAIKALSCLQMKLEWVLTASVRFNGYFARALLKIWLRLFLIDWFQIVSFCSHVFSCWKRKQSCQIIPTRKHLQGFNDIYRLVLVNQLPAM